MGDLYEISYLNGRLGTWDSYDARVLKAIHYVQPRLACKSPGAKASVDVTLFIINAVPVAPKLFSFSLMLKISNVPEMRYNCAKISKSGRTKFFKFIKLTQFIKNTKLQTLVKFRRSSTSANFSSRGNEGL